MKIEVKCSVDNCAHWKDNYCHANTIEVAKNFMENNNMEAGMLGEDSDTSSHTQCVTFKPRNKS